MGYNGVKIADIVTRRVREAGGLSGLRRQAFQKIQGVPAVLNQDPTVATSVVEAGMKQAEAELQTRTPQQEARAREAIRRRETTAETTENIK
jgi:hypothetical protein